MNLYLSSKTGIYSSGRIVFVTQCYTELVCTAFLLWMVWCYCLHKFSKYIPYKISIEKQRSIVDAWGLDIQNDI